MGLMVINYVHNGHVNAHMDIQALEQGVLSARVVFIPWGLVESRQLPHSVQHIENTRDWWVFATQEHTTLLLLSPFNLSQHLSCRECWVPRSAAPFLCPAPQPCALLQSTTLVMLKWGHAFRAAVRSYPFSYHHSRKARRACHYGGAVCGTAATVPQRFIFSCMFCTYSIADVYSADCSFHVFLSSNPCGCRPNNNSDSVYPVENCGVSWVWREH